MKRFIFPAVFLLFVALGLHAWNNDLPPAPAALSRLVPGRTTVGEFMALLGKECRKSHNCTGSIIRIRIGDGSTTFARERVIEARYRAPNSGMPSPDRVLVDDDENVITGIHCYDVCRCGSFTDGPWIRALAALSDWDRHLIRR